MELKGIGRLAKMSSQSGNWKEKNLLISVTQNVLFLLTKNEQRCFYYQGDYTSNIAQKCQKSEFREEFGTRYSE